MTPGINPIYAGSERSCPRDSRNVSYVDVGLVQTCLDLIESCGWWGGVVNSVRTQLSLGLNNLTEPMVGWILSVKYQRDDNTFDVADYMIYRTEGNR